MRSNFVRIGAVVDCENCRRRIVANPDLLRHQANTSGAEALQRLLNEFAGHGAHAPAPSPVGKLAGNGHPENTPEAAAAVAPPALSAAQTPSPTPVPAPATFAPASAGDGPRAPAAAPAPNAANAPEPIGPPASPLDPAPKRAWARRPMSLVKLALLLGAILLAMAAVAICSRELGRRDALQSERTTASP
jgi:hypothetical protein